VSDDIYVVKANTIAAMEGFAKTHFLNPNAKRMNKSLGDLVGLQGIGVHLMEIEPGDETTEYHVHHHEDEAVYVLEGEGVHSPANVWYSILRRWVLKPTDDIQTRQWQR